MIKYIGNKNFIISLLGSCLVFPIAINNFFFGICLLLLVYYSVNNFYFKFYPSASLIFFIMSYTYLVFNVFTLTIDLNFGIQEILKRTLYVVLPILFLFFRIEEIDLDRVFKYYIAAVFLGVIYCLLNAFKTTLIDSSYWIENFTYHNLSSGLELNALYLSCYINVGLFYLINLYFENRFNKVYKFVFVVLLLCLFLLKTVTLIFAFIFGVFVIYLSKKRKYTIDEKNQIGGVFAFLLLCFFIVFKIKHRESFYLIADIFKSLVLVLMGLGIPRLLNYVKDFYEKYSFVLLVSVLFFLIPLIVFLIGLFYPVELDYVDNYNNINSRYGTFISAIRVYQDNLFFGIGLDIRQTLLDAEYAKDKFYPALSSSYNEHNQFMRFFLEIGVLGVCYIFFLIYQLYKSLKYNLPVLTALVSMFTIFSYTETFLVRQKGILVFIFFMVLYDNYINYLNSDKN